MTAGGAEDCRRSRSSWWEAWLSGESVACAATCRCWCDWECVDFGVLRPLIGVLWVGVDGACRWACSWERVGGGVDAGASNARYDPWTRTSRMAIAFGRRVSGGSHRRQGEGEPDDEAGGTTPTEAPPTAAAVGGCFRGVRATSVAASFISSCGAPIFPRPTGVLSVLDSIGAKCAFFACAERKGVEMKEDLICTGWDEGDSERATEDAEAGEESSKVGDAFACDRPAAEADTGAD